MEALYLPLDKIMRNLGGSLANAEPCPGELYGVRNDIDETREVSAEHREFVERLTALAERAREDFGDLGRDGKDQRPAGWVDNPRFQLLWGECSVCRGRACPARLGDRLLNALSLSNGVLHTLIFLRLCTFATSR